MAPPKEVSDRIRESLRGQPQVDSNGVPIPTAPLAQKPTAPQGENLLDQLMDSVSFQEKAAQLDPDDAEGMQALIREHLNPAPKMQSNRLQGGGKSVATPKPKQSLLESLTAQFSPDKDQFDYSGTEYVE